jgi:nucleoside-diphosphate-sugar epimerase
MKVNATGTRHLVEYLKQHSPNAFFIYASSVSVYGDRLTDAMIRVGDPLLPSVADEYPKTKIEAKKIVMDTQNHKVSGPMYHTPVEVKEL